MPSVKMIAEAKWTIQDMTKAFGNAQSEIRHRLDVIANRDEITENINFKWRDNFGNYGTDFRNVAFWGIGFVRVVLHDICTDLLTLIQSSGPRSRNGGSGVNNTSQQQTVAGLQPSTYPHPRMPAFTQDQGIIVPASTRSNQQWQWSEDSMADYANRLSDPGFLSTAFRQYGGGNNFMQTTASAGHQSGGVPRQIVSLYQPTVQQPGSVASDVGMTRQTQPAISGQLAADAFVQRMMQPAPFMDPSPPPLHNAQNDDLMDADFEGEDVNELAWHATQKTLEEEIERAQRKDE